MSLLGKSVEELKKMAAEKSGVPYESKIELPEIITQPGRVGEREDSKEYDILKDYLTSDTIKPKLTNMKLPTVADVDEMELDEVEGLLSEIRLKLSGSCGRPVIKGTFFVGLSLLEEIANEFGINIKGTAKELNQSEEFAVVLEQYLIDSQWSTSSIDSRMMLAINVGIAMKRQHSRNSVIKKQEKILESLQNKPYVLSTKDRGQPKEEEKTSKVNPKLRTTLPKGW